MKKNSITISTEIEILILSRSSRLTQILKNVIVSQFDHNNVVVNLWYANSLNLISWLSLHCW